MFRFRSFRARLLTFFLGLLIVIQVSSLYFVDIANTRNAMALVGEALNATAVSFNDQIVSRNTALTQAGRLLSADFAFKTAWASRSEATLGSALDNQRRRIGANLMLLLSLDGEFVAGSGSGIGGFRDAGGMFPFPALIDTALNEGEAAGTVAHLGRIYSLIAVPLLTPVPSAWIVLGFEVDDAQIQRLREDSHADITLVMKSGAGWQAPLSTLNERDRDALTTWLTQTHPVSGTTMDMTLAGDGSWFGYINPLPAPGDAAIYAVLQRAAGDALAPYHRMRVLLIGLLIAGLLISMLAGAAIASGVTRPVGRLVEFAHRIRQGDYQTGTDIRQRDEIGQLAQAFDEMARGLYERDRVRTLLGKVISPEIAEELINKDVQLGGEERELTILFTDLRGFTTLSESRSPAEVLGLLNEYLTRMTAIIDQYGGVVDKYIGDAIMALFGAPLALPDHPRQAVLCALDMTAALADLNREFTARGLPALQMGIGINTGNVVVGNMGSHDRLNYTAIGDNVNLAARLESATKDYAVPILVSESTRLQAGDIEFERLDRITVKGKQEAVTIYTPRPQSSQTAV